MRSPSSRTSSERVPGARWQRGRLVQRLGGPCPATGTPGGAGPPAPRPPLLHPPQFTCCSVRPCNLSTHPCCPPDCTAGMSISCQLSRSSSAAPPPTSPPSACPPTLCRHSCLTTRLKSTFTLVSWGLGGPAMCIVSNDSEAAPGPAASGCRARRLHLLLPLSSPRPAGKYVALPEWDGQQLLACEWQVSGSAAPAG